jgi:hypothetical protein
LKASGHRRVGFAGQNADLAVEKPESPYTVQFLAMLLWSSCRLATSQKVDP